MAKKIANEKDLLENEMREEGMFMEKMLKDGLYYEAEGELIEFSDELIKEFSKNDFDEYEYDTYFDYCKSEAYSYGSYWRGINDDPILVFVCDGEIYTSNSEGNYNEGKATHENMKRVVKDVNDIISEWNQELGR